jgi:hypothetical protein
MLPIQLDELDESQVRTSYYSQFNCTMTSFIAPQVCRAFRAAPKAAPWARLSTQLPRVQPAFRRFYAASAQEQPRLRLGSTGMKLLVTPLDFDNQAHN